MSESYIEQQSTPVSEHAHTAVSVTESQIFEKINALKALFDEKVKTLQVRLDGMDRAQQLFHEDLVRVPTAVDKAIASLKELHQNTFTEKLAAVVEKFSKQIETQERLLDARTGGLSDKIDALKDLVLRGKGVIQENLVA